MKATLTTLLALAMLSGTAFAITPTYVSSSTGAVVVDPENPENPQSFYGIYQEEEGSAVGADVAIHEEADGIDCLNRHVYGGYTYDWADDAVANNNKVTMTSGQVTSITVGETWGGDANNNTFVMEGGTVFGDVQVSAPYSNSNGNVAILTGGSIEVSLTVGATYGEGYTVNNNKLHLVGEGAVAEIADAQGNAATYTGSSISLGQVVVAGIDDGATAENNSIDIYGAGIEATSLDGFDQLNFHMVNDLATTSGPMISLDGPLPLYTLLKDSSSLSLYGEAVTDWAAFEDKAITLISNTAGIYVLSDTLKENYDILDASGAIVATATLSVVGSSGGPQSLVVSNIQSTVPEPTTGTLSLLALAGLCIRRRK